MYELNAAGETTNYLLANLIEALKEAPDNEKSRLEAEGNDLMEEAEMYYQEAINTHKWGKKAFRQEVGYAFKMTNSETVTEEEKEKPSVSSYEKTIKA
jgi:hypothetical protein